MEEIREVLHFENGIEHKILITYVIAKVSVGEMAGEGDTLNVGKIKRPSESTV